MHCARFEGEASPCYTYTLLPEDTQPRIIDTPPPQVGDGPNESVQFSEVDKKKFLGAALIGYAKWNDTSVPRYLGNNHRKKWAFFCANLQHFDPDPLLQVG